MKKQLERERQIKSCRVGRVINTRLVKSSQMPKDFFRGSTKHLSKVQCSEDCSEDREIFEQFKSMFKVRQNLQSLAIKYHPKDKDIEQSIYWSHEKENMPVRFPSLYLNCKPIEEHKILKKKARQQQ